MIWQDIVISIINIIFSLSLIPQVYYGFKAKVGPIRYQTSIPTFLGLYVITPAYFSLHLYFAAGMGFVTGTLWLLLCIQRRLYSPR